MLSSTNHSILVDETMLDREVLLATLNIRGMYDTSFEERRRSVSGKYNNAFVCYKYRFSLFIENVFHMACKMAELTLNFIKIKLFSESIHNYLFACCNLGIFNEHHNLLIF